VPKPPPMKIEDCLEEVAGACYCIAAADGTIAKEEVRAIASAISLASGGRVAVDRALKMVQHAYEQVEKIGRDEYLWGLGKQLDPAGKKQVLTAAALTMIADGEAADSEREVYLKIAQELGFEEADAEDIIRQLVEARFAEGT
jgi:tellurite resistance protein